MTGRGEDVESIKEVLSEDLTDELLEQIVSKLVPEDHTDELLEQIASKVVDKVDDEFPELGQKSRPMSEALDDFRDHKLEEVDSVSQYDTKLDYLQTYLEDEINVESTEDLTSQDIERYDDWRKYDSLSRDEPLTDNTLRDDMYLVREFVQYLIKHGMVPDRFEKNVEIPEVDYANGEGVDEKKLDPEKAKASLDYLSKYRYASVEHVSMLLMCESGPRKSGLIGCDVSDFCYEERALQYEDDETTPLKNGESSQREIDLHDNVPEVIQDYINNERPSVTDDEGRDPLLTKGDGRMAGSTLKKIAYKWTRPCKIGLGCPHDRDPEDCDASQTNNQAFQCPSSRAPHHIRTGYITDQRNRKVSPGAIEYRCDASPRVQELHYDLPDDTEERERYEDEFQEADDDPDSGFNHG